jgi:hypothetical protein
MSDDSTDGLLFAAMIDWLVDHAPDAVADLPFPVTVEDGTGLTMNTGTYVHVGTADPYSTSIEGAADADQEWPLATQQARDETGSLVLSIESNDDGGDNGGGDTGQKRARDRVVQVGRRLLQMIRRDTRMGIAGMLKTSSGGITFDQGPTDNGVGAVLVIHITYSARIQGGLS